MNRLLLWSVATLLSVSSSALAHMVYVVPTATGTGVNVVFSDSLDPDENVAIAKIAALKLAARDAAGKDTAISLTADKHSLVGTLPGSGPRVAFGSVEYGVLTKGGAKPYMLVYHPKAIVGPINGKPIVAGTPLELIPVPQGGRVAFQLVAAGKPVAGAEVSVLLPDGKKEKVMTGDDGRTTGFAGTGRFAAYAKHNEAKSGEKDDKKYEEVRHYATLVVAVEEHPAAISSSDVSSPFPPLPKGASSLGAIVADGFLYVYGGHAGKTHTYDTTSVLGTFHRLKLDGGTAWEALPSGPIAQGMNLAAHNGKVIRVGGMSPQNAPGTPTDNISLTEVARFDPATKTWEQLPALPEGRSSHDVVVAGDQLVVVGGWNQKGKDAKAAWHSTTLLLDLNAAKPEWKAIPQPFQRRALTAAVVGTKVYVVAGLTADGSSERTVDILDLTTQKWTNGPEIPGSDRVGFSPAATTVNGRLIVNTLAGPLYRLTSDGAAWEKIGEAGRKRMVARLVPLGPDAVGLVGGAGGGGNVDLVEVLKIPERGERIAAPAN